MGPICDIARQDNSVQPRMYVIAFADGELRDKMLDDKIASGATTVLVNKGCVKKMQLR